MKFRVIWLYFLIIQGQFWEARENLGKSYYKQRAEIVIARIDVEENRPICTITYPRQTNVIVIV